MAIVMTPIYTQTVGAGGAASVTFNNIPQYYTDLVIQASVRSAYGNPDDVLMGYFNNSASNCSGTRLFGWGTGTVTSDRLSNRAGGTAGTRIPFGPMNGNGATSNTFGSVLVYIPNYTSANFKSVIGDGVNEANQSQAFAGLYAGLWSSTSAITSITLDCYYANINQYSTFSLYGIIRYGA